MRYLILLLEFIIIFNISMHSSYGAKKKSVFTYNTRENIVKIARKCIGVRYRYGGVSSSGFDCSGFVMYVFKKNGITIPRGVLGQYKKGKRVKLKEAKPGDLVFFHTLKKRFSHVGIYLGNFRFIHAPSRGGRVSISNMKIPYWKKRYIGAIAIL